MKTKLPGGQIYAILERLYLNFKNTVSVSRNIHSCLQLVFTWEGARDGWIG